MKRALDALEDDAAPGADEDMVAVLENVLADLKKDRLEQEAKRLASGDTRTTREILADEAARLAAKALQPKATGAWTEEEREELREIVSGFVRASDPRGERARRRETPSQLPGRGLPVGPDRRTHADAARQEAVLHAVVPA